MTRCANGVKRLWNKILYWSGSWMLHLDIVLIRVLNVTSG